MALRDWEASESYRKYLRQYGQQDVEDKLRERSFTRMFAPEDHVVHCFVGNLAKRPRTFMLLGLFYPHRDIVENYQEELFSL
ncbi:hypothetical protein ACIO8F_28225 [Streptomyces sp. NPDC087228]|uniref:hypothetical protein n=1 Tax=unclassified Streptomyces TaxID=2593676 RepID=UPI0033CEA657